MNTELLDEFDAWVAAYTADHSLDAGHVLHRVAAQMRHIAELHDERVENAKADVIKHKEQRERLRQVIETQRRTIASLSSQLASGAEPTDAAP